MSGPKTSKYALTPEQRRILAEQRQLELRKSVAAENIKRDRKSLLLIGRMFDAEKHIADELRQRVGSDNGASAFFEELDELTALADTLVRSTNFDDVDSVERASDEIGAYLKKAENLVPNIRAISSVNEAGLRSELRKAIDEGFSASFADLPKEINTSKTDSLRNEAAQRLAQIQRTDFLPLDYKSKINSAVTGLNEITDDVFLKNFIAVSVNPLIKQVDRFITEYEECRVEFDKLYTEYSALCGLYGYAAREYVCSRSSVRILKTEIERIKRESAEDDERAYISDCLDEVMVEMGYSVLGSREVTKRNGKRFRNELYAYGDGTAVNVTYSSDGKIAMELGGTDTSDRVPTAKESARLCDSMEQFCDDFREIEKRLLAKGVVLSERISLFPPEAEYAQIINTSDYDMETGEGSASVKKRRRSSSKQKSRREE